VKDLKFAFCTKMLNLLEVKDLDTLKCYLM